MKLAIGIPILNQFEVAQETINNLKRLQKFDNKYVFYDNGSHQNMAQVMKLGFGDIVIRSEENVGVPKALNYILENFRAINYKFPEDVVDYIFLTHSDIEMFEQDWDKKLLNSISNYENKNNRKVGVAGFFGAMGIGTSDIYQTPYQMQQLVRTNTIAGNRCKLDPAIHGHLQFNDESCKVAVLDGFGLVVRNVEEIKFEEGFGPHHMYDNDICLTSYSNDYDVICVNMDINHLGGRTDVNESWNKVFNKEKHEIHRDAHLPFYEKWRGKLPFRV